MSGGNSRNAGSREAVLAALRESLPQSSPLPDVQPDDRWLRFDDKAGRFAEVLESVGGTYRSAATAADASRILQEWQPWSEGRRTISCVPEVADGTIDEREVTDPHELEAVDIALVRAEFGVAENGAVWVTDRSVKHRVLFFLPQHLVIVMPADLVNNMHEAYARISPADSPFGAFISGPSKTADIEQSLVIGAHGARSLLVIGIQQNFSGQISA